ncbi:MAG: hypothetical protein ACR2QL_13215 [Woeseiaceae bacterium]
MTSFTRLVLFALLLPAAASASDVHVPDDLQDWQEWVLYDKEYRACPFRFNRAADQRSDFVCVWPGALELSVTSSGGEFSQAWTVYADEQWVQLPGNTNYWPHAVTANGRAVEVVLHDNVPSVFLEPGSYTLMGTFGWDERPGNLTLPWATGVISLFVDGEQVDRPARIRNGVFLGERQQETQARDSISSDVYRLVRDDVPTRLVTRIRIQVSGSVREELFGPILPDGFTPLTINSRLPARLESDGKLRVQVRPGSWVIEVAARGAGVVDSLAMPTPETNLPDAEIWSYSANDALRVTVPEGLIPVDPLQVDVPNGWNELAAFRVSVGDTLNVVERSRGIVSAENDLSLSRTMWMTFDREGFVVNDDISGAMRTGWRLDMLAPFKLLTAAADHENLLITEGEAEGQTGVELRSPYLNLAANAAASASGELPITAWDTRFNSVHTTLNLPPGHKLLAAPGVDDAPGSWTSQWQLLDFFLVLIIAIATWRLFGARAGVIALAALVLSFHEFSAPAWLWLNLLIAIALLRVAPAGRLRQSVRFYQAASAVLLVLTLVPFAANQLRVAMYPQLEPQRSMPASHAEARRNELAMPATVAVNAPAREASLMTDLNDAERERVERMYQKNMAADSVEEVVVSANKVASSYAFSRYAPNAIVQVGAGIPSWQWNSYQLSWSGPVDADQTMRLVIMPRWLVSLLRIVEVAFLLLFVAVLAAEILQRQIKLPGGLSLGRAAASGLAGFGLLMITMLPSQEAYAQTPDAEVLQELEQRLLAAPECAPRCAEIVAAEVAIDTDSIRMDLTVHALEDVAIPLPGSDSGWRPAAILLDGSAAGQISRAPDQTLWLRLLPGRHTVVLSGPIPAVDSLEISFPTPPRVVSSDSDGWFVAGIKDRRLLSGSLQLTRLQSEDNASGTVRWESSRFPPFVEVTRTVQMDLDWFVITSVRRIAPAQGALSLELPLLNSESVLTENMAVADGKILVSMAPNTSHVSWRSKIKPVSPLALHVEDGMPWQEIWRVGVSNIWHAEFAGVPESENESYDENARVALFFPRAGETLTVQTSRPEGAAGSTLAFDSVDLYSEHGDRSSNVTMTLRYRSTRGAQHTMRIPETAEVTSVLIDGESQSLRAQNGEVDVPILPGEHSIVMSWRHEGGISTRLAMPAVDIGAPASNISMRMQLPQNRWLLATNGPRLGPAVLYWSELAVLILAAIILARTGLAPLKTRHWLLLGLGFSTFAWPALGWVVVWLLVCGVRERWNGEATWWQFNLVQLLFAGLTVIALVTIVSSLPGGLLGTPDMHVTGNGSYWNNLQWFADQSVSALPTASAISVPMWVYKVLILGWALWLSFALLRWLPWVWRCFSSQGYWRPRERVAKTSEASE